jgi:hypothetical protein
MMATLFWYITKLLKKKHWTGACTGVIETCRLPDDPAFPPPPTDEISPETEIEK